MNKLMQIPCLLPVILFITSCNNNPKTRNEIININVDTIISEKPIIFSKLFSGFHIIPLESNEDCYIKNIDKIKIYGDTIYIFDRASKKVCLFSQQGKFISKVSKIGRGPGEFIQPSDFDIYQNSVLIFDWATKKINRYDLKGNFLNSVNLNNRFSSFTMISDNILALRPFPAGNSGIQEDNLLYLFDKEGKVKWKTLKYSEYLQGPKIIDLTGGGNFFKAESDVKFHMNYCNTIFSYKNKTLKPFLILNSNRYELKANDLEKYKTVNPSIFLRANLEKLTKISGYSENNNFTFLKFVIGENEYSCFYYFRSKKIYCSIRYRDDMTLIYPNLYEISNNQLIAYIHPRRVLAFKELIASDKIKVNDDVKNEILSVTEFNNPIIVLFDVKEN
jgi:hypothetical protein